MIRVVSQSSLRPHTAWPVASVDGSWPLTSGVLQVSHPQRDKAPTMILFLLASYHDSKGVRWSLYGQIISFLCLWTIRNFSLLIAAVKYHTFLFVLRGEDLGQGACAACFWGDQHSPGMCSVLPCVFTCFGLSLNSKLPRMPWQKGSKCR